MPPMRKSDAQPKEQRLVVDGEVEEHEYPEQHGVAGHEREQLDGQVGEGAAQCFPRRRFFCSDGSNGRRRCGRVREGKQADDAAAGHHHEQRRLDGRGRKADEGEQHNRDERRSCDAASAIRRRKRCEGTRPSRTSTHAWAIPMNVWPDQVQRQSRSGKTA